MNEETRPGCKPFTTTKIAEYYIAVPISMVMEIYKELSYLTNEASNAKLAERLLKLVKGD